MTTIYLDHNIIHYFVVGFPQGYDDAGERRALDWLITHSNHSRGVLSLWNLIEASREHRARLQEYGTFIERLSPQWMLDRRNIQRDELRTFLFREMLGRANTRPCEAVKEHLSQVFHSLVPNEIVFVRETPLPYMRFLAEHPDSQARVRQAEADTPEALRTLQCARRDGTWTRHLEERTLRAWLGITFPDRDPDNRGFDARAREALIARCAERIHDIRRDCPCIGAEFLLEQYRTRDPRRNPGPQDAADLMHIAPAISYCDAVVTGDGYLRGQAQSYARDTGRPLVVARGLEEVIAALAQGQHNR
jgi:hypothetical protein